MKEQDDAAIGIEANSKSNISIKDDLKAEGDAGQKTKKKNIRMLVSIVSQVLKP